MASGHTLAMLSTLNIEGYRREEQSSEKAEDEKIIYHELPFLQRLRCFNSHLVHFQQTTKVNSKRNSKT